MQDEVIIRPAVAADLAIATHWLQGAGLPIADLTPKHMRGFLLAVQRQNPVGMVGLERMNSPGPVGLLRSLVVDPKCRGGGLGRRLVAAAEALADSRDLRQLWLLTIDAEKFFARLGYRTMARSDAPAAIQSTDEFSSLCPGSAVLMQKRLV
jgi:amino-acid N-acetyltransferase